MLLFLLGSHSLLHYSPLFVLIPEPADAIAYLLAAVLAAMGVGFGFQQRATLRRADSQPDLVPGERSYLRVQAWLRLGCCALMLVLAGLVAGAYASGMEARATALGKSIQEQRERGGEIVLTPEEQAFRKQYGAYWIAALLVLLAIVIVAFIDIWTIRRFHRRTMKKLDADRRELIEEQVAILRSRRNGHVA